MPNFVATGQTVAETAIYQLFKMAAVLQLRFVCAWTTHKEYLVVFIAVLNLAGIDAVILIISMFQYFLQIWLEKYQFMPPFVAFLGDMTPTWAAVLY